jgi:peptidoglycan-N-acetylglucosamine deacetylase
MRFVGIPFIGKILYKNTKKSFPLAKGKLFFTFDDGPNPEVTPFIFDILREYKAKATFFCLGENVEQFPKLFERIKQEGHTVGNHSYNHINGFGCSVNEYLQNVENAQRIIKSKLFRPPYGKMKLNQYQKIPQDYSIILWDVMSYDFDPSLSPTDCETLVKKHVKEGSIVVFHDNFKAKENVLAALPNLLKFYSEKGYSFEAISI